LERLNGCKLYYPKAGSRSIHMSSNSHIIDLVWCTPSAKEMLLVIHQAAAKSWMTDKCLAGLVRALNDILRPQATLHGANMRLTRKDLLKLVKMRDG
jgi:hypothetical protein